MPHPVDRCQECGEPYYYHNDTWHTFVTPTGFCAHCQHNSEETRCFICGRTGHEIARQRHEPFTPE